MSTAYRSILRNTSVIGGASAINIVIGMLRAKFAAILLGPIGVGLLGAYSAICAVGGSVSNLGLNTSGVRHLSESYSSGDIRKVSLVIAALRKTVFLSGIAGAILMAIFSPIISRISFGNTSHVFPILLLSVTLVFANATAGSLSILQGMRKLRELATANVLTALAGLCLSVPSFYFFGLNGIVLSLLLVYAVGYLIAWLLSRDHIPSAHIDYGQIVSIVKQMLGFGFPLMLVGIISTGSAYAVSVLIMRASGLDGLGIWQASYSLAGALVNFVLGAMSTDYYPRISSLSGNNPLISQEVASQSEISMLLALPGLLATVIGAPVIISVFYSSAFSSAAEILRWSVLGVFCRVVSWPLGFVLLAKGKSKTFLATEAFINLLYVGLMWGGLSLWGLKGAAVAFTLMYVVYSVTIYWIVCGDGEISLGSANIRLAILLGLSLLGVVLVNSMLSASITLATINLLALIASAIYSWKHICRKSGVKFQDLRNRFLRKT